MNWISVKDKLPKDFEDTCCPHDAVLVTSSKLSYRVGIAQWYENVWDIMGEQGADSCVGFHPMIAEDITHWMPLPNHPK